MVEFIQENKTQSSIVRSILDGISTPLAIFDENKQLIFINQEFSTWFMYLSPDVHLFSEVKEQIDVLLSNELENLLDSVLNDIHRKTTKEFGIRTNLAKHKRIKVSVKPLFGDFSPNGALVIFDDQPQIDETIAIYRQQAHIDQLTGILNRFGFYEAFNIVKQKVINNDLLYALFMVDINGLKVINDQKGHLYGDKIIKTTAKLLSRPLREEDILCRWGGDEFLIIIANSYSQKHLKKLITKISQRIKAQFKNSNPSVEISMGKAVLGVNGDDLESLIEFADNEMYKGKRITRF